MIKPSLCCFIGWALAVVALQLPTESPTPDPQAAVAAAAAQEQPAILNPNPDPKPTAPRSSTSVAITRAEGKPLGKRNPIAIFKEIFSRGSKDESSGTEKEPSPSVNLTGTSYIAHVTVGSQVLPLLIDTGSSDLWVAATGFQCLNQDGHDAEPLLQQQQQQQHAEQGKGRCAFPATYLDPTPPGGLIPDEYFSIRYGNGQFLYGPYGVDSVSLGGVTVPRQRIALPSRGYFQSSTGDFAGILGLAYPAMVAARKGPIPKAAPPPAVLSEGGGGDGHARTKTEEQEGGVDGTDGDEFGEYDTWFFNAVQQGRTQPLFSLALDVDGGGALGIGEVVDVPVVGAFVSTPILKANLVNEARAANNHTFYTIMADDYILNGTPFSQLHLRTPITQPGSSGTTHTPPPPFPVIVDSGWTTNVLPPSLVTAFYDTFPASQKPQPVEIGGETLFAAPCGITPPSFGVQIGREVVLEMAAESIVVARLNTTAAVAVGVGLEEEDGGGARPVVEETAVCALGIQPGVEFAGVLGDTFLSSVVAVFDVGEGEMRFAQRFKGERGVEVGEKDREEL